MCRQAGRTERPAAGPVGHKKKGPYYPHLPLYLALLKSCWRASGTRNTGIAGFSVAARAGHRPVPYWGHPPTSQNVVGSVLGYPSTPKTDGNHRDSTNAHIALGNPRCYYLRSKHAPPQPRCTQEFVLARPALHGPSRSPHTENNVLVLHYTNTDTRNLASAIHGGRHWRNHSPSCCMSTHMDGT